MTGAALLAYAAALAIAVATPGPAMLWLISSGISRGARTALAGALGIALGDVGLGSVALLGLAAVAAAFAWLLTVVKYAAAVFLVWLGIRYWRASGVAPDAASTSALAPRALPAGLLVALSNPKAILFHASLMPLVVDLRELDLEASMLVLAIVFVVNLAVMSGYALLSGGASRWFRTPQRLRWMGRVAGGTMIGTGALVASR